MAYQPIQMPQPDAFGGLAELMLHARAQKERENQMRAELLLRTTDSEDQQRHRRALEDNARQHLEMQRGLNAENVNARRAEAALAITGALDRQRPDLAKLLGRVHGIEAEPNPSQDPRDALMMPSQEVQNTPPQPPPDLPLEMADNREAVAKQEEAIAEYKRQLGDSYQDPTRAATTRFEPGGFRPVQQATWQVAGVKYDPAQRREAEAATRTANTQRFSTAFQGVEGMGKYIPIYVAGVQAGEPPEKAFELMQKRMESDDARAARDENARLQREQSDTNNRRIAAAMGSRVSHDDPIKARAADRGDEVALDTVTKNVFGQLGFKEIQVSNRKFNDMANQLSKPNAALDAVTSGSFVKMAQGGTGVISDADMEAFWNRIGGVTTRTSEWVSKVMSGQTSPEKRAIVTTAIKELAARAAENKEEIRSALTNRLQNSSFANRTDDIIGTYFPETRSKIEDSRAIERTKNRTRAGRVKGGGRDRLDEELDSL